MADRSLEFFNRLAHTEVFALTKGVGAGRTGGGTAAGLEGKPEFVIMQSAKAPPVLAAWASEESMKASVPADNRNVGIVKMSGFKLMELAVEKEAGILLNLQRPNVGVHIAEFVQEALKSLPCAMGPDGEIVPLDIESAQVPQ